jgi:hypothetical protein
MKDYEDWLVQQIAFWERVSKNENLLHKTDGLYERSVACIIAYKDCLAQFREMQDKEAAGRQGEVGKAEEKEQKFLVSRQGFEPRVSLTGK